MSKRTRSSFFLRSPREPLLLLVFPRARESFPSVYNAAMVNVKAIPRVILFQIKSISQSVKDTSSGHDSSFRDFKESQSSACYKGKKRNNMDSHKKQIIIIIIIRRRRRNNE